MEHEPIIDRELFEAVQTKLSDNRASYHRDRTVGSHALLTGLIFDDRGNAMSPSMSRRPGRKSYLYYVSQARLQRRETDAMRPVPASMVESLVHDRLLRIVAPAKPAAYSDTGSLAEMSDATLRELVRQLILRVKVCADSVSIVFNASTIAGQGGYPLKHIPKELRSRLPAEDRIDAEGDTLTLAAPVCLWVRGGIKRVEGWGKSDWATAKPRYDSALIKALARATGWREQIESGEVLNLEDLAARIGHHRSHARQILKLAFLAPDIQRAILTGRQPRTLTLTALVETDLPLLWADQRTLLRTAQTTDSTYRQSGV